MKNTLIKSIYKIVLVSIIMLFGSLIIKKNQNVNSYIYDNIYNHTISFAKIKKYYDNYIGLNIPFDSLVNDKIVFNEKIKYKELNAYNNGIKLSLYDNYSIPILDDGIVIFIGNKDSLNKTVIIENEDGVDMYYGNLDKINVKLYDYVKKNDLLGNAKNNSLYLLFEKDKKYLDYKKFLK